MGYSIAYLDPQRGCTAECRIAYCTLISTRNTSIYAAMIEGFTRPPRHALPVHLIPLASSLGITDLVLSIVAFDEVLHDRSRLEEIDGFSIGESVSERWNASIGIDGREPWLLLCVLGDIDLLNLIG